MQKTSATLLIIDDDDVVRASLAAYLEDSGFSVLQAGNGQQGLQVFEEHQPDLVICDLRMPQMGGLELIRQVSERAPQLPVIVVSGAGVMSDAVEALRLGAADYLIKPLEDLAVLEHSVRRALDRSRLVLENQRYRDKLEAANRELEASLQRSTELGQVCQATLGQARLNLGAANRDLNTRLGQCLKDNSELVTLGQDLLQRYENKGLGEVLGANEPFIQAGRVRLENLGDEIRAKLKSHTH